MTQVTEGFASDRGIHRLNLELRLLEGNPRDAAISYLRIIRTLHVELMQVSSENLDMKAELDMARRSMHKLSQQLARQEDPQAAKEVERAWALAAAVMLRLKLRIARRKIRQQVKHNEQLHKPVVNHTTLGAVTLSNGTDM